MAQKDLDKIIRDYLSGKHSPEGEELYNTWFAASHDDKISPLEGLTEAAWQKSEQTYAISETFINLLNSFNDPGFVDPRAERWFTKIEGEIVGAPAGEAQSDLTHTIYSAPSTETVLYDEAPQPLLTYDEMKFIEAEAHLRLGNRSKAYTAYKEAVMAALRRSGISEEDIIAYVNQRTVFPGEDDLTLEHVIKQKNISFWMFQSLEAYNDFRRTGIPQMNDPGGTPLRLAYPPSEVNRNPKQTILLYFSSLNRKGFW